MSNYPPHQLADKQLVIFLDPDDVITQNTTLTKLAGAWQQSDDMMMYAYQSSSEDMISIARKPIPKSLSNVSLNAQEIADKVYPTVIFGQKLDGQALVATLWRAVFDYEIIKKNNIQFRIDIRKAEDWCFYSDYLLHVKSMRFVDEIFYNYRVRSNSTINTYSMPSLKGIEKGLSILSYIKHNAQQMKLINQTIVADYFRKRYVTVVLNYVKGLSDSRSQLSTREIYRKIDEVYSNSDLKLQLSSVAQKPQFKVSYLESVLVKYRLKVLMILYAKLYHLLKYIKT